MLERLASEVSRLHYNAARAQVGPDQPCMWSFSLLSMDWQLAEAQLLSRSGRSGAMQCTRQ